MAHLMVEDPLTRTKRVRVTPATAKELARDARELGLSESEAMRLGIRLLHRLAQRKRHGAELLALADVPGDDARAGFA